MEPAIRYSLMFVGLYIVALLVMYLIPAGISYWYFYVRGQRQYPKIQLRQASAADIRREVYASLKSLLAISAVALFTIILIEAGKTRIYFHIWDYSIAYFLISPLILVVIHDTYFYWAHRIMHHPRIFKSVHILHHKSRTPTPWAVYAFQLPEMLLQFLIFPAILVLMPIHPIAFGIFFLYNIVVNTGGHCGFEFVPKHMRNHIFFKYGNDVSTHDLHHSECKWNYGLYFNFWDRLMGTYRIPDQ